MLQGAGFRDVVGEWVVIAIWMVVSFALALRLFRWR